MEKNKILDNKTHTGIRQFSYSKGKVVGVSSSRDKVDEIWSMLRYDLLIDKSIDNKLIQTGLVSKSEIRLIKSELLAYVDQAENFYTYARNSDYRSAALLYYYSFLNLSKAYIILNRPNLVKNKFIHGLTSNIINGKLVDRSIKVKESFSKTTSVFDEIYNLEYGNNFPINNSIKIKDVLGYITDISAETSKLLGKVDIKIHPTKLYVFTNKPTNKYWAAIGISSEFKPENFKSSFGTFIRDFNGFNPEQIELKLDMNIEQLYFEKYKFFQSSTEFELMPSGSIALHNVIEHVKKIFGEFYQDDIYDPEISFSITDPLRKNLQVPFNEPLSIYLFMFYLSEVVRYNPGDFNNIFAPNTKEGWLIKSFIESSPYACLVYLVSKISSNTYIISDR